MIYIPKQITADQFAIENVGFIGPTLKRNSLQLHLQQDILL